MWCITNRGVIVECGALLIVVLVLTVTSALLIIHGVIVDCGALLIVVLLLTVVHY